MSYQPHSLLPASLSPTSIPSCPSPVGREDGEPRQPRQGSPCQGLLLSQDAKGPLLKRSRVKLGV